MKTKEELNAIKEELTKLNEKLGELTEEELKEVTGGIILRRPKDDKNGFIPIP